MVANQATLLIRIFGPFAEMANFFNQTSRNIESPLATRDKYSGLYISKKDQRVILFRWRHPALFFFSIMKTQKRAPSNFGFQAS